MTVAQSGVEIVYHSFDPLRNGVVLTVTTLVIVAAYFAISFATAPKRLTSRSDGWMLSAKTFGILAVCMALLDGAYFGYSAYNDGKPDFHATYDALNDYYNMELPQSAYPGPFGADDRLDLGNHKDEKRETVKNPMYNVPGPGDTRYEEGAAVIEDGRVTFKVTDEDGKIFELPHDATLDLTDDK